jgi:septum formation protein
VSAPPIILASASPRRKQLLTQADYKFTVVASEVDESAFSAVGKTPVEYAKQLALAKAKAVAEKYPDSLVIGADTVVDFDGRIIGKPVDAKDAEAIIRMLFSKPHKVITGIAIVCKKRNFQIVEAETTVVYPKKLTDAQIAEHIKSGIWRDKAGAYAIREPVLRNSGKTAAATEGRQAPASPNGYAGASDPFVDHIEGSLTNVMGLPMELLGHLLDTVLRP